MTDFQDAIYEHSYFGSSYLLTREVTDDIGLSIREDEFFVIHNRMTNFLEVMKENCNAREISEKCIPLFRRIIEGITKDYFNVVLVPLTQTTNLEDSLSYL